MLQSLEIQVLPFLKPHEFIVICLGAGNGQKEVFNENDLCNYFLSFSLSILLFVKLIKLSMEKHLN